MGSVYWDDRVFLEKDGAKNIVCDTRRALKTTNIVHTTRIMVSKGMVSKSKYSISEKNKGMPVSICPNFLGYFLKSVLIFSNYVL